MHIQRELYKGIKLHISQACIAIDICVKLHISQACHYACTFFLVANFATLKKNCINGL